MNVSQKKRGRERERERDRGRKDAIEVVEYLIWKSRCGNGRKNQCRDPGSNRGPSDLQSDALPTELSRQLMSRALLVSPTKARWLATRISATGTRTRVARVRAEYPNQLDYSGLMIHENTFNIQCLLKYCALSTWDHPAAFTRTLECRLKHIITMSLLHEKGNVKTFPNHFLCI